MTTTIINWENVQSTEKCIHSIGQQQIIDYRQFNTTIMGFRAVMCFISLTVLVLSFGCSGLQDQINKIDSSLQPKQCFMIDELFYDGGIETVSYYSNFNGRVEIFVVNADNLGNGGRMDGVVNVSTGHGFIQFKRSLGEYGQHLYIYFFLHSIDETAIDSKICLGSIDIETDREK